MFNSYKRKQTIAWDINWMLACWKFRPIVSFRIANSIRGTTTYLRVWSKGDEPAPVSALVALVISGQVNIFIYVITIAGNQMFKKKILSPSEN